MKKKQKAIHAWWIVCNIILLANELLISKMSVSFFPKSVVMPPCIFETYTVASTVRLNVPADSTENVDMNLIGTDLNSSFLPLRPENVKKW